MKNPSGPSRKTKPKPKKPLGSGPSVAKKASSPELLGRLEEINHLVENSPVVLFKWKAAPGWPVEFVTQNVAQFGYTAESFLSGERSYASIVFPEDLERIAKEVNDYSALGREKFYQEYRILAGDGSVRWIDDRTIVERDRSGRIAFYQGIILDVTGRKHIEEAVREKTEELDRIFTLSLDLLCIAGIDGRFIKLNPAWEQVLGYSLAELKGRMFLDFVHPDDVAATRASVASLASGKEVLNFTNRYQRRDGSYRWIEWLSTPFQDKFIYAAARDITERKQAEEALRESEYFLNKSQEVAQIGSYTLDIPSGSWVSSPSLDRIFGIDDTFPRTVEGWLSILSPLDREMMADHLQNHVIKHRNRFDRDYRIIRHDTKEERWVSGSGELEYDMQGNAVSMIGTIQDITDRKKSEQELLRTTNTLSALVKASPLAIILLDLENKVRLWNPAAEQIFGWSEAEALGTRFPKASPTEHEAPFQESMRQLRDETFANLEIKSRTKGGALIDIAVSTAPVRDLKGEITGIMSIASDISARRKIEDILLFLAQRPWAAAGEDFFSSLAAQIAKILSVEYVFIGALKEGHDAISTVIFYGDGKVLPNIEYDLGNAPCEQVVGQIFRIFPSGLRKLFPRASLLQKIDVEGYAGIPLWDSRGRAIGLLSIMSRRPLRNEQLLTSLLQIVAVRAAGELESKRFEDMQTKLQEQLSQAQKMESVGLLAGGVAHDFNNLLTPILGYTELMRMNLPEGDPDREKLQYIIQSAERAKDLTKRLLAFSRKQILDLKIADLGDIVRQFEGVLNRTIRENVHIRVTIAPSHGLIKADKGQIEQVLLNLAINAQDAMPNGGTLEIAVDDIELDESYAEVHPEVGPGRYVMLSVRDTGMGMDAETQEHIFEPFFTSKELGKGTGLGLSTVYGIVKQHGGSILVYSEKGNGSIFKIFLPKVAAGADVGEEQSTEQSELLRGRETILVVEDNETVRTLTCRMLESLGYTVIEAQDVDACFALMKKQKSEVDLLLTDVVMPRMNGKELFTHLRNDHPDLKVLYMSGYTRDVIGHDGILEDAVHFIQKPFSVNAMAHKIREALGK